MEFPVTIKNGYCDLRPLMAYLSSLRGDYKITVDRVAEERSLQQNRWLWGCIYPMLLNGLIAAGWEFTNKDEVHDFCERFRGKDVVNRQTGEVVRIAKSTKEMTTFEMAAYCETLRDFAEEYLGITIPDPDPEHYGK